MYNFYRGITGNYRHLSKDYTPYLNIGSDLVIADKFNSMVMQTVNRPSDMYKYIKSQCYRNQCNYTLNITSEYHSETIQEELKVLTTRYEQIINDENNNAHNLEYEDSYAQWVLNVSGTWSKDYHNLYHNNKYIFSCLAIKHMFNIIYTKAKNDELIKLMRLINNSDGEQTDSYLYFDNKEYDSKTIYIYGEVDIADMERMLDFKILIPNQTDIELISRAILTSTIRDIVDIDSQCDALLNEYHSKLTERTGLISKLNRIEHMSNNINILFDTLKKINGEYKIINNKLCITIQTELFNYDETLVTKMYERGDFEERYGEIINRLIKLCFIDNRCALVTKTTININLDDLSIRNDITLSNDWFDKRIPYNPHIGRYNCFGQNGPVLTDLLTNGKWEEFVYCLKATLGNLNFNDSTVCDCLFEDMWGESETSFIWGVDKQTGDYLTVDELIDICKKEYQNEKD